MSATMTLQPSSANLLEIASPNPEPPPVTIATLPLRRLPRTLGSADMMELYDDSVSFQGIDLWSEKLTLRK